MAGAGREGDESALEAEVLAGEVEGRGEVFWGLLAGMGEEGVG